MKLLVDLDSGEIIEDSSALDQKEAELSQANKGKLHPKLKVQLGKNKDDTKISVCVWIQFDPEKRFDR